AHLRSPGGPRHAARGGAGRRGRRRRGQTPHGENMLIGGPGRPPFMRKAITASDWAAPALYAESGFLNGLGRARRLCGRRFAFYAEGTTTFGRRWIDPPATRGGRGNREGPGRETTPRRGPVTMPPSERHEVAALLCAGDENGLRGRERRDYNEGE